MGARRRGCARARAQSAEVVAGVEAVRACGVVARSIGTRVLTRALMARRLAAWSAIAGAWAAGLLTGCGEQVVRVDVPGLERARAWIVAVRDEQRTKLYAQEVVGDEPVLSFEIDSLGEYDVQAVLYGEALAELGFTAGELPIVTDDPRVPVPQGIAERSLAKDAEGRPTGWVESPSRPAWLSAVNVRGVASRCTRFSVTSIDAIPTADRNNNWGFAVVSGPEVVAGTDLGELFEIDTSGHARAIAGPPEGLRATAAVPDDRGGIWVGDTFGRLWFGNVEKAPSTWMLRGGFSSVGRIDYMDLSPDGTVMGVLTRDGAVASYTIATDTWRVLHRLQTDGGGRGGVLALGPDDFIAGGPFANTVTRIRGGFAEQEMVGAEAGVTSLREVPGIGVVLGTGLGEVFVRRDGRWEALPASGSRFWVLGMAPLDTGFVFGSPYGSFGQYVTPAEACPLTTPVSFFIRFIVPLEDRLVLLGESLAPPAPGGAVLTRR